MFRKSPRPKSDVWDINVSSSRRRDRRLSSSAPSRNDGHRALAKTLSDQSKNDKGSSQGDISDKTRCRLSQDTEDTDLDSSADSSRGSFLLDDNDDVTCIEMGQLGAALRQLGDALPEQNSSRSYRKLKSRSHKRRSKNIVAKCVNPCNNSDSEKEESIYTSNVGFPKDFHSWHALNKSEIINITTNNTFHIPRELAKSESCRELRLTRNMFEDGEGFSIVPESIKMLKNLEVLSLRGNNLQDIQLQFCDLLKLRELHLDYCGLYETPKSLAFCSNLRKLVLDHNNLESIYSSSVKFIDHLQHLSLVGNKIIHLSDLRCSNLTSLDLSENQLEGISDDAFLHTQYLQKLYLRSNKLRVLPTSLYELKGLKYLDASYNQLAKLHEEVNKLKELRYLNVSYNDLTRIPKSITELALPDDRFLCGKNPLQKPPLDVCLNGLKAILDYYTALEKASEIHNKRMRMILLGETTAGKFRLSFCNLFSFISLENRIVL